METPRFPETPTMDTTMPLFSRSYSSSQRPLLQGARGAVAAAHPLSVAAGQEMLVAGGSAADALIAAQAVLTVISPEACGLGGDMLALAAQRSAPVMAVTGAGRAPMAMQTCSIDGANSITVPGIVGGWQALSERWGRLDIAQCLAPAVRLAEYGFRMGNALAKARDAQRARLVAGGAAEWIIATASPGDLIVQPELGRLLRAIGEEGAAAFYTGPCAAAIERAVMHLGGALGSQDLAAHVTEVSAPVSVSWQGWTVHVQPPPTQGVLLAMALQARAAFGSVEAAASDHLCIEATEAAFAYRSRCAEGNALLSAELPIDTRRAAQRGGPRAYLHTAGIAATDASGLTLSSLVSVFDDFGSCVFVPELGITLNNRAAGFTDGANAAVPGKRPVHTLAPALLTCGERTLALATPGADGQVQTLLQILDRVGYRGMALADAVSAPRWRSEGGAVLIEDDHPAIGELEAFGHRLRPIPAGDMRFGAVVAAGCDEDTPFALSDWRRECWSGVA